MNLDFRRDILPFVVSVTVICGLLYLANGLLEERSGADAMCKQLCEAKGTGNTNQSYWSKPNCYCYGQPETRPKIKTPTINATWMIQ